MQTSRSHGRLVYWRILWRAVALAAIWHWTPAREIRAAGNIGKEDVARKAAQFPHRARQWEGLRAQLQSLLYQSQAPTTPEQFARLDASIADMKARMKAIRGEVSAAAEAAWLVDRDKNQTAFDFLNSFVHVAFTSGQHQEAAELAECLLQRSNDIPDADKRDILLIASQTSFNLGLFDQARQRLDRLRGIVPIDAGFKSMSDRIDNYRRLWGAEQRIRARERAANDLPLVKLVTTKGQLTVELFKNEAPVTTTNFLRLVGEKFYDRRPIDSIKRNTGFEVGADATDTGKKGISIVRERALTNRRSQFRGSLCMLDSGERTSGTCFMITFVPIIDPETNFTVFGQVIDGYDVLDRLVDSDQAQERSKKPEQIEKASVLRR
jgi:cyclophilin family peptidyl-prolyl cis-trans isomerase